MTLSLWRALAWINLSSEARDLGMVHFGQEITSAVGVVTTYLMKTLFPARSTLSTGSFSISDEFFLATKVEKFRNEQKLPIEILCCWRSEERRIAARTSAKPDQSTSVAWRPSVSDARCLSVIYDQKKLSSNLWKVKQNSWKLSEWSIYRRVSCSNTLILKQHLHFNCNRSDV